MNHRPLIIFLLANFFIAMLIIINFSNKPLDYNNFKKEEVLLDIPQERSQVAAASSPIEVSKSSALVIASEIEETKPEETVVCMDYGPLDIEQKSILDTIVTKEKINKLVSVSQKNQFEVYWNLGSNQALANEMFERQKKDALQDKKFQLTKDNGEWIVSIAVINDNLETAKAFATKLGEKANKVNSGGKWQYRTLPNAYYYHINNINAMSPNSQAQITTGMGISKQPCAN